MLYPRCLKTVARIAWLTLLPQAGISTGVLFAQADLKESVVVTANASPITFQDLGRGVTIISREEIEQLPVHSVPDLLRYVTGVDVRSRSPFGVQSDISARGAGFGQTLILVNGIRMNDSQTGHHNTDLPVALADIERVEVLHGTGSSVYGGDAFGAAINIITRDAGESQARFAAGSHGLAEAGGRAIIEAGSVRQTVSLFGIRSSGFMFDRDFANVGVNSETAFGSGAYLQVGHLNKEFGANGFYGPSPSKEWTDATMIAMESPFLSSGARKTDTRIFYRTHGDHFLWDVRRPGFAENHHRTHSIGTSIRNEHEILEDTRFSWGGEAGHEWIDSNNLGRHAYDRWGLYAELQQAWGDRFSLVPGIRFDHYTSFGSAFSPSLSAAWWVHPRLKLRSSAGHAFRVPTFTELYYSDPNHLASPNLLPEEAWELESGADWIVNPSLLVQVSAFSRWDQNLVDWVRESADQRWRTANIRALDTRGLELGLQKALGGRVGLVSVQYAYLDSTTETLDLLSKYALDFARHAFSAFGTVQLPGRFRLGQDLHFKVRSDGRRYWVLNQKWSRELGRFNGFLEVSNLLDSRYEEIRGVIMPGRWIRAGLECRIPSF